MVKGAPQPAPEHVPPRSRSAGHRGREGLSPGFHSQRLPGRPEPGPPRAAAAHRGGLADLRRTLAASLPPHLTADPFRGSKESRRGDPRWGEARVLGWVLGVGTGRPESRRPAGVSRAARRRALTGVPETGPGARRAGVPWAALERQRRLLRTGDLGRATRSAVRTRSGGSVPTEEVPRRRLSGLPPPRRAPPAPPPHGPASVLQVPLGVAALAGAAQGTHSQEVQERPRSPAVTDLPTLGSGRATARAPTPRRKAPQPAVNRHPLATQPLPPRWPRGFLGRDPPGCWGGRGWGVRSVTVLK